jgi:hypothetical protein
LLIGIRACRTSFFLKGKKKNFFFSLSVLSSENGKRGEESRNPNEK